MTPEGTDLTVSTVIYATDFSVWSQSAGLYASFVAQLFSAKLLVAHAFTLTQAAMEVEIDRSLVSQQRQDLQFLLSRKAFVLGHDLGEAIPVLVDGDPREMIPGLADKNAAPLIVMGSHGGGWIERRLIGSVAEAILQSSFCPCLTVSPRVRSVPSTTFPFRRILYVTDFTPASARAAVYAISFAQQLRAEINVLNVVERKALDHPEQLDDLAKPFYSALNGIGPHYAGVFCNRRTFAEIGKAHNLILQHIREQAIDLLVLGIQRSSHLGTQMTVSEAFQLIVDSECPVLTIPESRPKSAPRQ